MLQPRNPRKGLNVMRRYLIAAVGAAVIAAAATAPFVLAQQQPPFEQVIAYLNANLHPQAVSATNPLPNIVSVASGTPSKAPFGQVAAFLNSHGQPVSVSLTNPLPTTGGGGGGGGVSLPLPFFGANNPPWSRPALSTFSTWLNQSCGTANVAIGNAYAAAAGQGGAVAFGSGYVPGDTITVAGGTSSVKTVLTLATTQIVTATIHAPGIGGTDGTAIVSGTTGTPSGGGALFQLSVTISSGGISAIKDISYPGSYTANPSSLSIEPVTGAGLIG